MTKEQKIYCKIGQIVAKGTVLVGFSSIWAVMFLMWLVK